MDHLCAVQFDSLLLTSYPRPQTRLSKTFRIPYRTILLLQCATLAFSLVLCFLGRSKPSSMVGQTARRRIQKPLHRLSAGEGLLSNTTSIEHGALWHIDITKLPPSSHPELRVWSNAQVHEQLAQIVPQVPSHFDKLYKNPCWHMAEDARLSCLPYTYLLGMPKCGTSDLYERIIRHPEVHPPERKEVRRGIHLKHR
jgi:hypothetical protein